MQRVKDPRSVAPAGDEERATPPPEPKQPYLGDSDLFDSIWRFFCSTRLALILILLIAAAGLAGTLLHQAPAGISGSPDYSQWLGKTRLRYGAWTDLLSVLQLFDVFNAIWFRLLLALLVINIVICTVNRWNGLWRSISRPRVRMGAGFFKRASHSVTLRPRDVEPALAADSIRHALGKLRYRVLADRDESAAYLYADKNRYGKLGTFLGHLSLVLILVGAILGGVLGFRNREFIVPVGSERAVGNDTNLTLRVDEFIDEYYPEGPPKDFRSDVVLFDDGKEVAQKTIRVNDPLEYQGIRFYQSFFGPAAAITVKDSDGTALFNDGVGLAWRSREDRPVGSFTLPSKGLEVYVVAPISGKTDALVPAGQMRLEVYRSGIRVPEEVDTVMMGQPKKIGDLEFTFQRELQFTGLQVSKDPGAPIVWLASTLLVVGLAMVFYFPHRRIWIVCQMDQQGRTQVMIGATARRDVGFDEEFRRVVSAVERGTASAGRTAVVAAV